ncbi:hypothetical protein JHN53_25750 [Streptomyces sp. MBT58]|uniref:DUF11 domain-containing protein n=1 Tax=Streptomyces sp. MBT58 TaxID=1488389 RepID=UPI0019147B3E|nr:DUF11 domain-containing protein [Streptomyces sp. MBT58]MBK5994981.1 hypothetical protein [Streptomyces sp. MBT58]
MRPTSVPALGAISALVFAGLLGNPQSAHAAGTSDLKVALSASAFAGTVTYQVRFENDGPDRASGTVTGTVELPAQTTSASASLAGCPYDSGTKTVTCDLSGMPEHEVLPFVVTAQISPLAIGPLNATAKVTSVGVTDPHLSNNTSSAPCMAVTSLLITC